MVFTRHLTFLLLVCLAAPAGAQKKPVTLDSISGGRGGGGFAGAPAAAIWAPDGKRFVWRQGDKVRVYDIAAKTERDLFSTAEMEKTAKTPPAPAQALWENRGVREQRLQWSALGNEMLLVLQGDLYLYRLSENKWEQLTATPVAERDPKLSPDGQRVSFRRDHDLYTLEIGRKKLVRLTSDGTPTRLNAELDWVYPEELALGTAHWWSPDSRWIAYLQFEISKEVLYPHADLLKLHAVAEPERYPYAGTPNADVRLGIVAAAGGKTRWLDPGPPADGLIARVDWLPDSREVAIQRLTRIQDRLELLAFEAASGKRRLLLEESDPAWVNLGDELRFLKNSPRFLWASERDGFRHLYLHSMDGAPPQRITSGAWEVADMNCLDEANGRVYYTATEPSPLERHFYSVRLDGTDKRRLTTAAGSHQVTMGPGCQFYTHSFSSLTEPPSRTLRSADGAEVAVLSKPDRKVMEEYELLPVELLQVRASDGAVMHARLIKPVGFQTGRKYPAIVMVYGGPLAQTVRNSWRGADWDQVLAHRGFVIWQVDNRGSAGRGHAWEAVLHRKFGERELADQKEGLNHLIAMGFVDAKRVGIYGWSYGGYMTLYSLLNAPETFQAGIAGAPVTDWRQYDTIYTERYMGLPSQNEEGYKRSSPVHFAGNLKGRLMLAHNFEDDNVLFQHTLRMMDALQKAGKPFDLLLYPQKSHGVGGPVRRHMLEAMTAFFERHLKL